MRPSAFMQLPARDLLPPEHRQGRPRVLCKQGVVGSDPIVSTSCEQGTSAPFVAAEPSTIQ
jgi:hypothetical protein